MNRTGYDLYGRTRFSLRGSLPETVLNACIAKGIEVREAEYSDDHCITVWVYEKDAAEFKKTVGECMCFCDKEETAGREKTLVFFRRHIPVTVFTVFFGLCLIVSSLFIWDIEVVGNEKLTEAEIKRTLEECGVGPGCFWPGIDNDMVRAGMLTKLPQLAWMSVNVNGSRATVPVLERKSSVEIYNENTYSDLIAKCDGIVEKASVKNGKAFVSRGQAVEKGDLLISGNLDSSYGKTEYVNAFGEVYARTWREKTAVCPELNMKKQRKPGSYKRYAVMLGKKRINFYIDSKNTVDEYDKIIHNNKLGIKSIFTFPVTVISEEFVPYAPLKTEDTDVGGMENRLMEMLEKDVDGDIVSTGSVSEVKDGLKRVTVRCECLENIAEEKKR